MTAVAGEVGELANVLKKVRRGDIDLPGHPGVSLWRELGAGHSREVQRGEWARRR